MLFFCHMFSWLPHLRANVTFVTASLLAAHFLSTKGLHSRTYCVLLLEEQTLIF